MSIQGERQALAYRARPEPGQLVEVRRRQWVVADVDAALLDSDHSARQHCITLSSIDEDGLGEGLEVIWEIEPGAQVIERAGLPLITGQDDSGTLDAFLDAVRWGGSNQRRSGIPPGPVSQRRQYRGLPTRSAGTCDRHGARQSAYCR